MNWDTVAITLKLAFTTTLILLPLSLPIAYWLVFSQKNGSFWRKQWSPCLGAAADRSRVLRAGGHRSVEPVGRFYESVFGSRLPFTFGGCCLRPSSTVCRLRCSRSWRPFKGRSQIDRSVVDLGVSSSAPFQRDSALSVPGVITALVLSFAHTIGEFGVVVMVGGNIQGVTRTMSIEIYDHVQALDYASAGQTSLVLLLFPSRF
jgi:molybdate transport system permease protein